MATVSDTTQVETINVLPEITSLQDTDLWILQRSNTSLRAEHSNFSLAANQFTTSTVGLTGNNIQEELNDIDIKLNNLQTNVDSLSSAIGSSSSVPTGVILPFSGNEADLPSGYLICDGRTLSTGGSNAALFNVIGYTYGGGGAVFNIPDIRSRLPVGKDDMNSSDAGRMTSGGSGIDGDNLGSSGGSQEHLIITPELANHSHTYDQPVNATVSGGGGFFTFNRITGISSDNTTSEGGNSAHNNIQPTIVSNYIIKS